MRGGKCPYLISILIRTNKTLLVNQGFKKTILLGWSRAYMSIIAPCMCKWDVRILVITEQDKLGHSDGLLPLCSSFSSWWAWKPNVPFDSTLVTQSSWSTLSATEMHENCSLTTTLVMLIWTLLKVWYIYNRWTQLIYNRWTQLVYYNSTVGYGTCTCIPN